MRYFDQCKTVQEAKLQYRAWSFRVHPDTSGSDGTEFKELSRQYAIFTGKDIDDSYLPVSATWEAEAAEGLVSPKSPIRLYVNFASGWIAFQTLDCKTSFCFYMADTSYYAELKKRSIPYERGRHITIQAKEFSALWAMFEHQKIRKNLKGDKCQEA